MDLQARSHTHISERAEDLGLALLLLHVFAEGAMSVLHVGELVFVLDEEVLAILAHMDRHIWNHILEISLGRVSAVVAHILDEDLLPTHAAQDVLVNAHRLVVLWRATMVSILQQDLSEQIILKSFVLRHRKDLLLLADALVPAATTRSTALCWSIHAQKLLDSVCWQRRIRHEFN